MKTVFDAAAVAAVAAVEAPSVSDLLMLALAAGHGSGPRFLGQTSVEWPKGGLAEHIRCPVAG